MSERMLDTGNGRRHRPVGAGAGAVRERGALEGGPPRYERDEIRRDPTRSEMTRRELVEDEPRKGPRYRQLGDGYERSVGELVSDLSSEVGDLVSTHARLAVVEARQELRESVRVVTVTTPAVVFAYLSLLLFSFAFAWGLAEIIPVGWAFATIAGGYLIIAGFLFLVARLMARDIEVPPRTRQTLQEDKRWLKQMS